jgi:hypothetical protein
MSVKETGYLRAGLDPGRSLKTHGGRASTERDCRWKGLQVRRWLPDGEREADAGSGGSPEGTAVLAGVGGPW